MQFRIMIIEQEESLRETFALFFTERGHEAIVVEKSDSCPAYQRSECRCDFPCADMIIAHKSMQGMSGHTFFDRLMQKGCQVPRANWVMMSGFLEKEDFDLADAGGYRLLQKPVTLSMLNDLLEDLARTIPPNRQLSEISPNLS